VLAGGQEQVPQPRFARLRLELVDLRVHDERVLAASAHRGVVARDLGLGGLDPLAHEGVDVCGDLGRAGRNGEVHVLTVTPLLSNAQ